MSKVDDPAEVTGVVVAGLTNPDFLIEVEAIAFVPGKKIVVWWLQPKPIMHSEYLQFDKAIYEFEETTIYGIFESYGYMSWHIELFPRGEENYIMFNSLVVDGVFSPAQLSSKTYAATAGTDELYEHTVRINGEERFLRSIEMTFGQWDNNAQSIQLTGKGIVDGERNIPVISYGFNAILIFTRLNIFETTKEATQLFVETHLQESKGKLNITFEKVACGFKAVIIPKSVD